MKHKQCRTWNMARKLKNVENGKCTLQDLEYGEKTDKQRKCETHMVGHEIWRETMKIVQNEKHTMQDQEYGENTDKIWIMRHTHLDLKYGKKTDKWGK